MGILDILNPLDPGKGGTCPWCGSNRLWGRSGHELRHCKNCNVTFNTRCPFCNSIHNSFAWNPSKREYGCDRCHRLATPEELIQNRCRSSPFT